MPPVTVPVPIATSYFQYDQQGVVFNMWYFGWFDDAMTQFLGEVGYPYTAMNADGLDVQLVHTEAHWRDAVRYGEQVVIDVATERIGSTSFTLSFSVRVGEQVRSAGRPSTWWSAPTARASGRYRPSSGLGWNPRSPRGTFDSGADDHRRGAAGGVATAWTRFCPRTSGPAACPGGSTPSRPTTSGGSPNCWTGSAGIPARHPGS